MNLIPLNLVFEDQISEIVMIKLIEKVNKSTNIVTLIVIKKFLRENGKSKTFL